MLEPLTNGHLDLLTRESQMFDKIILAIAKNPSKLPLFTLYERISLASQVTTHLHNVTVTGFNNLVVDLVKTENATILIRGIRMIIDLEYEIQLAKMHQQFMPKLETVFMIPAEHLSFISSSLVKEVALHGGNTDRFLPFPIAKEVYRRFNRLIHTKQ